jgi:hypothetical protein
MNIIHVARLVLVLTTMTATPSFAEDASLKDRLLGSWSFVASITTRADGTKLDAYGQNASGIATFDAGGHFSIIIVISPSGAIAHTPKCSQSPQACFEQASDTCSGSYAVLDSHNNAGGLLADIFPGPVTWYNMTYTCRQSNMASYLPTFQFRGAAAPSVAVTNCQRYGNSVSCQSY